MEFAHLDDAEGPQEKADADLAPAVARPGVLDGPVVLEGEHSSTRCRPSRAWRWPKAANEPYPGASRF
jgi:hypothetical protein